MPKLFIATLLFGGGGMCVFAAQRGIRTGVIKGRYNSEIRRYSEPLAFWGCIGLLGAGLVGTIIMAVLILSGSIPVTK
jgi:hypothetical protein